LAERRGLLEQGLAATAAVDVTTLGDYGGHMNVGVRELKEHLSEYIERAARGEVIRVTDRGRPRAILAPLPEASRIDVGVAEGWVRRGNGEPVQPVAPQVAHGTTAAVLDDDRADR
jgi:prevent-host-death family protein